MAPSFLDHFSCQASDSNIYTTRNILTTVTHEQPKITLVKRCSLPPYQWCIFLICSALLEVAWLGGIRNEEIQGGSAATASSVVFKRTHKCVEFILLLKGETLLYVFKG